MSSSTGGMHKVRAANLQRSRAYQAQFNLPEDELLVDEFNCALQQKILLQGKLYISQNFACFYANIFGQETTKVLLASNITGVQLAKMLIFPNSIKVFLTYETYFFASFLHRDDAYKLLTRISRGESIAHMGIWAKEGALEKKKKTKKPVDDYDDEDEEDGNEGDDRRRRGSDEEDDDERPRKGGHGRSGSLSKSPGPRSPTTGASVVRHTSLLSDNAFKLKSEQERQRSEKLRESQRQLREAERSDNSQRNGRRSDEEEEDEEDDEDAARSSPQKRNKGKAASASAAAVSSKKAASRKQQQQQYSDEEGGADQRRRGGGGGGRGRDADYDDAPEDDDVEEEAPKRSKKNGKSGGPSPAWIAAATNAGIPKELPSVSRRARVYLPEPLPASGVDPAVAAVAAKFKNKKLGLDAPGTGRRLLHQGPMKRQGGWSVVDRWCFLFSDHFLFAEYDAKDSSAKFKEKQKIPLVHLLVDMRPPGFQSPESLLNTKLPNAFRLLDNSPNQSERAQYVCSTLTLAEKIDWGRRLGEAISKAHAQAAAGVSTVDRTPVGWYTQFVRGMLPYALIHSSSDDTDLLSTLLRTPAFVEKINDLDQEGNGLLHLAVLNDTPALLAPLVAAGADLHVRDWDGLTVMHVAVLRGNIPAVNALLELKQMEPSIWHPMDPKGPRVLREQSALWMAAVTHYASAPAKATYLVRALVSSTKAAAREFLDERSEKSDMTLLDYCAFNPGMEGVAEMLLKLGASVDLLNLDGLQPLAQAVRVNNTPMVELLLNYGAQPNLRFHKHGLMAPLHHCRPGAAGLECARALVSHGARWQDSAVSKSRDGLRIKDLFPSISAQNILRAAEESFARQGVVENPWEAMKPPASGVAQNNRHDFDSCALCQLEFTLVNKREYCRRCGWNICNGCSTRRMVFIKAGSAAAASKAGRAGGAAASASSSSNGPNKERVCDGCYNLVATLARSDAGKRAQQAVAAGAATGKTRNGDAEGEGDEDGMFHKSTVGGARKAAAAAAAANGGSDYDDDNDDDEELGAGAPGGPPRRGAAGGGRRAEPSGFKSVKRLNVDSEDEDDLNDSQRRSQHSEGDVTDSVDEEFRKPAAKSKPQQQQQQRGRQTRGYDDDDADAASDDNRSTKKSAAAASAAAAAAADEKSKTSLGARLGGLFSKKSDNKKPDAAAAAAAAAPAKKARRPPPPEDDDEDSEEADERFAAAARREAREVKEGKVTSAAAAAASAAAAAASRRPGTGSSASGRSAAASAASPRSPLSNDSEENGGQRRPGRPPGWSKREGAAPSSDEDDDDGGGATDSDVDDGAEDPRKPKKKEGNFFSRGLQSVAGAAQGAAKKAGNTIGGAMNSAKSGITKLANTVQEKVTAASAAATRRGGEGGEEDEDEDPAEAARQRRREAARERVRAKRAAAPAEDDDDDDEEEIAPRGSSAKAASTAARLGDAKRQARANQDLLDQMEHKGDQVEEGGREFQSLAAKLKAKSKASKF